MQILKLNKEGIDNNMKFVTDEDSQKQYKEFLEKHERCNFQQSLEWAEVKNDNWKPEVILAEDEEKNIIGSLCVWIRKMPIFREYDVCIKRTSM